MGTKYKEVGGGAASGVGNEWATFLGNGLATGSFGGMTPGQRLGGSNPVGQTGGIAGVLNDILSGGAGNLGGALGHLLQTQQTNDIADLRSRFGVGGGTSFGSPAAFAESQYRSQVAPQIATQVGNLQLGALSQLFPQFANLAQIGIPKAEVVGQQSPWLQAAQLGLGAASAALPFFAGPFGAAASVGLNQIGQQLKGPQFLPQGNFGAPQWEGNFAGGQWVPSVSSMFNIKY